MTATIHETTATSEVKKGGRLLVKIIDPGEGSSGTYPADTLADAVENRVFPRGTHMYINHASPNESYERPEGDLRNLAGVLATDAYLDSDGSVVAEAKLYTTWADTIREMSEDIGVSIRGNAEYEETDGTRVITRITDCVSVDFVTRAGRGGRILQVLESAKPTMMEAREAMAEETKEIISAQLTPEQSLIDFTEDRYVYRDWSDGLFYRQGYTLDGEEITLEGERKEIDKDDLFKSDEDSDEGEEKPEGERAPATRSQGGNRSNGSRSNGNSRVGESATGLSEAAQAQIDELSGRLEEARRDNRSMRVEAIVAEAFAGIDAPKGRARLVESGMNAEKFDADKFKADAIAEAAEYRPAGVHGMGRSGNYDKTPVKENDIAAVMMNGVS